MSDERDHTDHEKCEKCEGCVPCGCICHLAPETEGAQEEAEAPLTLASMGLLPFRTGDALTCPKCSFTGLKRTFHEMIVISMDENKYPCQEWVEKNLLGGTISEHLCVRCSGCNYGFPMKTADA